MQKLQNLLGLKLLDKPSGVDLQVDLEELLGGEDYEECQEEVTSE